MGWLVHEAVQESLIQLQEWLFWAHGFEGECPEIDYLEQISRRLSAAFNMRNELHFLIFRKDNHVLIGSCSIHNINWKVSSAEIGYWCRTSKIGKGFIREAVSTLIDNTFNSIGLHRMNIICDIENTKSVSIPEILGFNLELEALGLISQTRSEEIKKM